MFVRTSRSELLAQESVQLSLALGDDLLDIRLLRVRERRERLAAAAHVKTLHLEDVLDGREERAGDERLHDVVRLTLELSRQLVILGGIRSFDLREDRQGEVERGADRTVRAEHARAERCQTDGHAGLRHQRKTEIIADIFPESVYIFEAAMHFRIVVVWAILAVVIGLVYAYVPGRKTCLKRQLPGAVVAAVGWSLITWGFSIYVEDFNGLTAYGKMTTVIILMLWLYFCMYIVLMGALFNHYYKRIFRSFTVKKRIDKMENTY